MVCGFLGAVIGLAGDLGLVMAGDTWMPWRLWGGLLNAAAVALFLANTARSLHLEPVAR